MQKNTKIYLILSIVLQLTTAGIHSLSFLFNPEPQNDKEALLTELLENYKPDLGAGFHPSTQDLFNALSACFPLLFIFSGLMSWLILRMKPEIKLVKGILNIQVIIFAAAFMIFLMLTFIPPITCTGLVLISLIMTRLSLK